MTTEPTVKMVRAAWEASEHPSEPGMAKQRLSLPRVHKMLVAALEASESAPTFTQDQVMAAIERAVIACSEQERERLPIQAWAIDYAAILKAVSPAVQRDELPQSFTQKDGQAAG